MVRGLDGFLLRGTQWRCAVLKGLREGVVSQDSGGYGEGETPLPIPNRAVKPLSADGTWPARARESRTPPVYICERVAFRRPVCFSGRRARRDATLGSVQTSRLELRPIAESDVDALVELDGFAEVREAIDPFGEHIPDDLELRRAYEARLVARVGFLAAVERESGRLVGWFQFERRPGGSGEIELGYRLRPDAWGRGLASEGARALVVEAMSRKDVWRVYAHALLTNQASIRVMERAGMTYARPWSYRGLPGVEYEARARRGAAGPGATPGPRSAPAKRP
jgi:RimJ/RimL family protein N-acetyltransferase